MPNEATFASFHPYPCSIFPAANLRQTTQAQAYKKR